MTHVIAMKAGMLLEAMAREPLALKANSTIRRGPLIVPLMAAKFACRLLQTALIRHWAAIAISWAGRVSTATAPPAASFANARLPPCAWAMVAQIASPRPRPRSLVV
jgi:hypothetical protein